MKSLFVKILAFCALAAFPAGAQVNYRLDAAPATNQSRASMITMYGSCNPTNWQYCQNLLASLEPSFGAISQQTVFVAASGTATSAVRNWYYDSEPANYYAGMQFKIVCGGYSNTTGSNGQCNGSEHGQTGTILNSTTGTPGSVGPAINFSTLSGGATIQNGDTFIITAPESTGVHSQWALLYNYTFATAPGFTMDTTPAHQPPALYGLPAPDQSLALTLASTTDLIQLVTTLDANLPPTGPADYVFSGNYLGNLDVNVISGSGCQLSMSVVRGLYGGGSNTILNQTQTLSGSGWQSVSFASSTPATETSSSPVGYGAKVTYGLTGCVGTVLVRNAILQSATHTNASVLTDATIAQIKALNPSGIRFNNIADDGGGLFGCSTIMLLEPDKYRNACNANVGQNLNSVASGFSLDEEMKICLAVGVSVCAPDVNPMATDADLQCEADYMGGGVGTQCGAIRVAEGQVAPWTTVFTNIPLEFGNEAWNSGTPDISWILSYNQQYFVNVVHFCQVMKAMPSWNPSVELCAANTMESPANYKTTILNGSVIDLQASSGYHQTGGPNSGITNCANTAFYDDEWAEGYENTVNSGSYQYSIGNSGYKIFPYESGAGFGSGNCATGSTPLDLGTNVGFGQVAPLMRAYLQAAYNGVYNFWSEFEFSFLSRPFNSSAGTTPTTTSYGWGIYAGTYGQYVNPRPQVYSEALFNACAAMGAVNIPVTTGQITTNHAASNQVPAQTGVPMMPGFIYRSGAQRCLVVANGDRAGGAHSFTVSGAEAPAAGTTVTKTLYASGNTFDQDNENQAAAAVVGPNVVSTSTGFTGDTLSPAQAASYVWSVGAGVYRQIF